MLNQNSKLFELLNKLNPVIRNIKQVVNGDETLNDFTEKEKYTNDASLLYKFTINQIISKDENGLVKVSNYDILITLGLPKLADDPQTQLPGLNEKTNKLENIVFFQNLLVMDPHKVKTKNCTPTKKVFKCEKKYFRGGWCSRCSGKFERSGSNYSNLLILHEFNQIPFESVVKIIERDTLFLTNFTQ